MSKEDHYAVGERKTVLVFSPAIIDETLLDQSIHSLFETLKSPTNRLYLDIVLFSHYSTEMQETWKDLFTGITDCSISFLPKTSDPWSSQLNDYLESEQVEQLIFITVTISILVDSRNLYASLWMHSSMWQPPPTFYGMIYPFTVLISTTTLLLPLFPSILVSVPSNPHPQKQ